MNRLAWLSVSLVFRVVPAFAQIKGCQCFYSNGSSWCGNAVAGIACESVCESNRGPGVTLQRPPKTILGGCPVPRQTLSAGSYATLIQHIRWAIWYQGARVYDGDRLENGGKLRAILLSKQLGHGQAVAELSVAPIESVESATQEAIRLCKTEANGPQVSNDLGHRDF
jgi:hypothetical protein